MNQFYNIEKLTKFRRELHQKPELSGFEKQTSAFIKAFLAPLKPDQIIENLGATDWLLYLKAKKQENDCFCELIWMLCRSPKSQL